MTSNRSGVAERGTAVISGDLVGGVRRPRAGAHRFDVASRCILREDGSMTQEQLLNLEREINTYRALNHPAIVR